MGYLTVACRVAIGLVFAVSAVSKLRDRADWGAFVASITRLEVVPARWVGTTAVLTAVAEVAVALLVAVPATALAGFILAVIVLIVFSMAILAAVRRGLHAPCRCFGRSTTPLGPRHVVRNALITAVAAAGVAARMTAGGTAAGDPAGVVLAVVVGLVVGALLVMSDDLADMFMGPAPTGTRHRTSR